MSIWNQGERKIKNCSEGSEQVYEEQRKNTKYKYDFTTA